MLLKLLFFLLLLFLLLLLLLLLLFLLLFFQCLVHGVRTRRLPSGYSTYCAVSLFHWPTMCLVSGSCSVEKGWSGSLQIRYFSPLISRGYNVGADSILNE
ncbi:MAG: hypothetical protein EBU84_03135 [Actinobacteria bacterium]|nr:hypothetical protein [Actinomycetota bacterium]